MGIIKEETFSLHSWRGIYTAELKVYQDTDEPDPRNNQGRCPSVMVYTVPAHLMRDAEDLFYPQYVGTVMARFIRGEAVWVGETPYLGITGGPGHYALAGKDRKLKIVGWWSPRWALERAAAQAARNQEPGGMQKLAKEAEDTIEWLNKWQRGEVYGYRLSMFDPEEGDEGDFVVDSEWGFYDMAELERAVDQTLEHWRVKRCYNVKTPWVSISHGLSKAA